MRDDNSPLYLVTGGGGFLGGAIVRQLHSTAVRIRSFSRSRYPELERMDVEQVQGDLADADAVDAACKGVTAVFHVAAKAGVWGKPSDFYRTNVLGTANVLAACRRRQVARLIYTSSPSVVFSGRDMRAADESAPYPRRYHADYPATKAAAERLVLQEAKKGLRSVVLRPHLIWGPGDPHLVPRILARAGRLARIGKGNNKVDTTYIDDAARAHLLADLALARRPELSGRVYFITGGRPVALWEMIDKILAAGGKPPVRKKVPAAVAYAMGWLAESICRLLPGRPEPPMTRFVARELATDHWFDIRAARNDLGYEPQVDLDEGMRRLAAWLGERTATMEDMQ